MRVVFLENVPGAKVGDIKDVADGYGRNYLLPRGLAELATPSALKRLDEERAIAARRAARMEAKASEIAKQIEGATLIIKSRIGTQERLYGSITSSQIADELQKVIGQPVDRRRLDLEEPIRKLGTYRIPLELSRDVTATVTVIVEGPKGERAVEPPPPPPPPAPVAAAPAAAPAAEASAEAETEAETEE